MEYGQIQLSFPDQKPDWALFLAKGNDQKKNWKMTWNGCYEENSFYQTPSNRGHPLMIVIGKKGGCKPIDVSNTNEPEIAIDMLEVMQACLCF